MRALRFDRRRSLRNAEQSEAAPQGRARSASNPSLTAKSEIRKVIACNDRRG